MDFSSFGLHPRIAAGVHAQGYTTPTPIQTQAIPSVLNGDDVLGLAQTGTGKTAAFALPILQRLLEGPRKRVRALVLAPTRELAEQIHQAFRALGAETGLRSAPVYGGVGFNPQLQALRGGAEIIVACPGRLLDHLEQGTADLSAVEVLVLDEADRMFDMGFLPDIRRILRHVPARRQALLFSATMPPDIRRLASEVLVDPVTVEVDRDAPAATVAHALYPVEESGKGEALLQLLYRTDTESVLVFTRTKHRAKRVAGSLVAAGFQASCLQGNLSQTRRQEALDGFRSGRYQVLVATDIAARGIDVSTISHVINFDMPDTVDAYTHRIGRTGRAARTGDAFTLVTPADESAVRAIERVMGARIERRAVDGAPARAVATAAPAFPAQPTERPRPNAGRVGGRGGSREALSASTVAPPAPRRRRGGRSGGGSAPAQPAPASATPDQRYGAFPSRQTPRSAPVLPGRRRTWTRGGTPAASAG